MAAPFPPQAWDGKGAFLLAKNPLLRQEIEEFLLDREARLLSSRTLSWYRHSLNVWATWTLAQGVTRTESVTPSHLRAFITHLRQSHNPGGVANIYGAVRAYLRWYDDEYQPAWDNPLAKVKAPSRTLELLEPLSLDDFRAMLDTFTPGTFTGDRGRAMFYLLLDTGVRRQELTDMRIGDVDMRTGQTIIPMGKGAKTRYVIVGSKTRKALRAYLRHRDDQRREAALWVTVRGKPMTAMGIRQIVRRASEAAGLPEPGFHAFQRAFAVNYLRNGGDLFTLQRMLGHTRLEVTSRYAKLATEDLRRSHKQFSPVDHL